VASPGHPAPDRAAHRQFCLTEQWTEVQRPAGGTVRHHLTYELHLDDGRVLRTRISRPPSRGLTYGPSIWGHILRDQLEVTEEEFWACVDEGKVPVRSRPAAPPPEAIPAGIVFLLRRHGVREEEILALTKAEAVALLATLLSEAPHG